MPTTTTNTYARRVLPAGSSEHPSQSESMRTWLSRINIQPNVVETILSYRASIVQQWKESAGNDYDNNLNRALTALGGLVNPDEQFVPTNQANSGLPKDTPDGEAQDRTVFWVTLDGDFVSVVNRRGENQKMRIVGVDLKTTHALLNSKTILAGNEAKYIPTGDRQHIDPTQTITSEKLSPTIAIVHDTRVKIKSTGELVHLPSELNKANAAYEALGAKIKETNDGAEVEKLGVKAKELNQRIDLLKSVYPE